MEKFSNFWSLERCGRIRRGKMWNKQDYTVPERERLMRQADRHSSQTATDIDSLQWLFSTSGQHNGNLSERDKSLWQQVRDIVQSGKGIVVAFLSGLALPAAGYLTTSVSEAGVPRAQVICLSLLTSLLLFLPLFVMYRSSVREQMWKRKWGLVGLGLLQLLAIVCSVTSYSFIPPIKEVAIVGGALPFFAAIFACLFIEELPSCAEEIGMTMCAVCTAIIFIGRHFRLSYAEDYQEQVVTIAGIMLAIACSIVAAAASVLARQLQLQGSTLLTTIFYTEIVSVIVMAPFGLIFSRWDLSLNIWLQLVGLGVLLAIEILGLYYSLSLHMAPTVQIIRNSSVLLGLILQYYTTALEIYTTDVIGTIFVILAILPVMVLEWKRTYHQQKHQEFAATLLQPTDIS